MNSRFVCSLSGSTFLVSEKSGDFVQDSNDTTGFFYKDTRHLSSWRLLIDGKAPQVLSCDDVEYYYTQHFLAPQTGTIYENPYLSLIRRRTVADGFIETLQFINHRNTQKDLKISVTFGSDFCDLFEIKDALAKKGKFSQKARGKDWVLKYQRDDFVRETLLSCSHPCRFSEGQLEIDVSLAGKEEKIIRFEVLPKVGDSQAAETRLDRDALQTSCDENRTDFKQWFEEAPEIQTSIDLLRRVYRRSMIDLSALRFFPDPQGAPKDAVPAAGLPWFMSLFGRDSLLVSYQALPFQPDLARSTLRTLAARQGTKVDHFRDEEPGKILHELRVGELTYFQERPQSPYFGASDSTPLFLIVLDEYERWSGDRKLVEELKPNALRALEWIDKYGDRDGDGFVEYKKDLETSLDNQCWKDSWNSILFADGTVAEGPRAPCEIQGYIYDAKVRTARLAREVWKDPQLSERLLKEAAALKEKFNQAYWIEDKKFYALALDGKKRQVDSLTSNIGHLLWSGIVPEDRAKHLVDHLMGDRLFSGWGVRTMAEGESGYNPIEYHNGTVWPHDNSIIAAGLARYGYREEANRICIALVEAALFFRFRLPEVFAGYSINETEFPVEYPTASSPQAWATGAPLLFLRTILGLDARGNELHSDPVLPPEIGKLILSGIPGRWGKKDVSASRKDAKAASEILWTWFEERAEKLRIKRAA